MPLLCRDRVETAIPGEEREEALAGKDPESTPRDCALLSLVAQGPVENTRRGELSGFTQHARRRVGPEPSGWPSRVARRAVVATMCAPVRDTHGHSWIVPPTDPPRSPVIGCGTADSRIHHRRWTRPNMGQTMSC